MRDRTIQDIEQMETATDLYRDDLERNAASTTHSNRIDALERIWMESGDQFWSGESTIEQDVELFTALDELCLINHPKKL